MACVLDAGPGSVVSHRTAAARWGLPGFSIKPVEVTGKRGRVRNDDPHLGIVHQPRRLLKAHVVEIDGVDTTTPTRTLFDLAGTSDIHPMRLERLLDTCWSRNLVSHASLSRALAELAARGRSGITLMRRLLAERPPDHRPPDSSTEARFQQLARRAGLNAFERQLDVGDDEAWIGRVDFVDRRRNLIVEVDPALFHGSLTDQTRDSRRHAKLRSEGWCVISVTDFEIYHRSDVLVDRLRRLAPKPDFVLV